MGWSRQLSGEDSRQGALSAGLGYGDEQCTPGQAAGGKEGSEHTDAYQGAGPLASPQAGPTGSEQVGGPGSAGCVGHTAQGARENGSCCRSGSRGASVCSNYLYIRAAVLEHPLSDLKEGKADSHPVSLKVGEGRKDGEREGKREGSREGRKEVPGQSLRSMQTAPGALTPWAGSGQNPTTHLCSPTSAHAALLMHPHWRTGTQLLPFQRPRLRTALAWQRPTTGAQG